jgi:hypothetical protein
MNKINLKNNFHFKEKLKKLWVAFVLLFLLLTKANISSIKYVVEKPAKLNCLQEQLVLTDPFRVSAYDGKGSHYQDISIDS